MCYRVCYYEDLLTVDCWVGTICGKVWLLCLEFADIESSCFEASFHGLCFLISVPIHSDDDGVRLGGVQLVVLLDVVHCDNIE